MGITTPKLIQWMNQIVRNDNEISSLKMRASYWLKSLGHATPEYVYSSPRNSKPYLEYEESKELIQEAEAVFAEAGVEEARKIEAIASIEQFDEGVLRQLISSLDSKKPMVRSSAAKGLVRLYRRFGPKCRQCTSIDLSDKLYGLLDDHFDNRLVYQSFDVDSQPHNSLWEALWAVETYGK